MNLQQDSSESKHSRQPGCLGCMWHYESLQHYVVIYVSRRGRISMLFLFFFPLPDTHLGVKHLGNVRSHQVRHPGRVTDWEITHIF